MLGSESELMKGIKEQSGSVNNIVSEALSIQKSCQVFIILHLQVLMCQIYYMEHLTIRRGNIKLIFLR